MLFYKNYKVIGLAINKTLEWINKRMVYVNIYLTQNSKTLKIWIVKYTDIKMG